jgi:HlyD family secretion protein
MTEPHVQGSSVPKKEKVLTKEKETKEVPAKEKEIVTVRMETPVAQVVAPASEVSPSFLSRHKTYVAFLFVVVSAIVFYALFSRPQVDQETYTVTSGPIKQYVRVSGQVEASNDANLSFQTSGAVSFVGVKTGDKVDQGKVLMTLEAGDAQSSLLQAQANLSSTQAVLAQLRQGARKEELAYKEQLVENAKNSLAEAYNTLPDAIQNVDSSTADVVKNKFSALFITNNSKYLLSFSSCDQRLQSDIEEKRTALETTLADFQKKSSVITAISSTENIDATFEQAYQAALLTNDLVNSVSNLLLLSCSLSNTSLNAHRATLSGVKATMTALFSDITVKRSLLLSSKNALNQSKRDLELTKAGTDPYKIQAQRAAVEQAQAQVSQAKTNLNKTILTAPFSGVISSVNATVGETLSVGKVAVSMLSVEGLQIEAKVPEVDIVKVKVGSIVEVTLDAYGQALKFPATITRINPTATTEGSVPIYKVIVTFTGTDERIKEGMTTNVNIVTEDKPNVVLLPSQYVRTITSTKGQVTVIKEGQSIPKTITIGIRGSDGLLEIKDGLFEGEEIVPFP